MPSRSPKLNVLYISGTFEPPNVGLGDYSISSSSFSSGNSYKFFKELANLNKKKITHNDMCLFDPISSQVDFPFKKCLMSTV